MSWRLAQSLVILRDQINAMFPDRDKRTDGVISGYPGAISGHNVNAAGVVCAMDITTGDYPGGITMAESYPLADAIRNELLVAPRGLYTYIIHHMEPPYVPSPGPYIAHGGPASLWQWIPYAGTDPHTSHIHISVDEDIPTGGTGSGEDPYDMTDPWNLGGVSAQSGTITPIQGDEFDMASIDDLRTVVAQEVAKTPQAWFTNKYGQPVQFESLLGQIDLNINNNHSAVMGALLSIAQGVGTLKANPASFDAKALAAELAPLLTTNQAHQFIVALGQALPKE